MATPSVTLSHDQGPARQPDRHHLQIRRRQRREVHRGLPRPRSRRRRRRRADVRRSITIRRSRPRSGSRARRSNTRKTVFVPVYPYVGEAAIQVGLHSTKDQKRLPLAGEDVGQNAYRVARMQLLPQTETCSPSSRRAGTRLKSPTRTRCRMAVDEEGRDAVVQEPEEGRAVLLRRWTIPAARSTSRSTVQVSLGGQVVDEFTLQPKQPVLRKIPLQAAQLGDRRHGGAPDLGGQDLRAGCRDRRAARIRGNSACACSTPSSIRDKSRD